MRLDNSDQNVPCCMKRTFIKYKSIQRYDTKNLRTVGWIKLVLVYRLHLKINTVQIHLIYNIVIKNLYIIHIVVWLFNCSRSP